jgi:hypothetical protein
VLFRSAGFGYNIEMAGSSYDANTLSNEGPKQDLAEKIQLDRVVGGINLGANYQRAGTNFASIANPGATYDREQYALTAGTALGTSSLSTSLSRSRDNLGNDATRPVVYNNNVGLTYALTPKSLPALSFSYLYGQVKSESEPVGSPRSDILNQSGSAALSYAGKGWSSNLALNNSWMTDPLNGDTSSRNATFAGNMKAWDKISLAPTVSYSNSDHLGALQQNTMGTLSLNWHIIAPLSLSGQMTWTKNDTSGNVADNIQRTAILRMAWDITPSLKSLVARQQSGLTLSYSGSHYADHIDPSQNRWDQTILLGLQIFSPLEGEGHF